MDRSFTARQGFGRAGRAARPLRLPWLRRDAGAPRGARRVERGPGLLARAGDRVAAALALVWRRRRARIALLTLLVAIPLLGGAYVLLRHSSFVRVEHVRVIGVHGPEAAAIESALSAAARHMSTLDAQTGPLRAAVAPFRVVREVSVHPHFPHGLSVDVVEQLSLIHI